MSIGARIHVARHGLGFTQRYVAKALSVTPAAVNQWESDTTRPTITKRAELAVLLNLRLDELIPEAPANEVIDTIARIIHRLPLHKQAALVVAIEGLARLLDDPPPVARSVIFRNHRCWKCQDGAKPCAQGSPNQCEFPMARNH